MPTIDINPKELEKLSGLKIPKDERKRMEFFECVKGEVEEYTKDNMKLEIADSNRLDIWTIDGIARMLKAHHSNKVEKISFMNSNDLVDVDPRLKNIRPYISMSVVKNVELSAKIIKILMAQQEKIDNNYGRGRKRTSIGLYNYDLISFPLRYTLTKPSENGFVPLEMTKKMKPGDIIKKHPTAEKYSHLLGNIREYPILLDDKSKVLSMPPLINSNDLGKISPKTKNILIEVTGNDESAVDNVTKIMALSLVAYNGKAYSTRIKYSDKKSIQSPNLSEPLIQISIDKIRRLTGVALPEDKIKSLLKKAGYWNTKIIKDKVFVKIPYYRTDIMHEVDVIEDIMINYGYNKFKPEYPDLVFWGDITKNNKFSNRVREACVGMGLQETANFVLTNKENLTSMMGIKDNPIQLSNPMSETFTCMRTWLIPSLMQFLSANTHNIYPQKIFEVGDSVIINKKSETGSDTIRNLAITSAHEKANLAEIRQYLDNLSNTLGISFKLKASVHGSFIPGRTASIYYKGKEVGVLGEIHPKIIKNFNISVPVVALELNLSKLI